MSYTARHPAAFINALSEGPKSDVLEWLQRTWDELCDAKAWQPIETAPKDVEILVSGGTYSCEYSPLEFYGQPFKKVAVASYSIDHNEWADLEYTYQPSHWMPIPCLPTTDRGTHHE